MGRKRENPEYKIVVIPNKNSNKTFDDIIMSKEFYDLMMNALAEARLRKANYNDTFEIEQKRDETD